MGIHRAPASFVPRPAGHLRSPAGAQGIPAGIVRQLAGIPRLPSEGHLSSMPSAATRPAIISAEKVVVSGTPLEERICTSHVERTNLHIRMSMRRFTRLTNAFSRKRDNLRAALALHFAAYNVTWMHSSYAVLPLWRRDWCGSHGRCGISWRHRQPC
jgi:hypothetical protein